MKNLIALRKRRKVFGGGALEVIPSENEHILGFMRVHAGERAVIFANFSESPQVIPPQVIEQYALGEKKRLRGHSVLPPQGGLTVEALDFLVFGK